MKVFVQFADLFVDIEFLRPFDIIYPVFAAFRTLFLRLIPMVQLLFEFSLILDVFDLLGIWIVSHYAIDWRHRYFVGFRNFSIDRLVVDLINVRILTL